MQKPALPRTPRRPHTSQPVRPHRRPTPSTRRLHQPQPPARERPGPRNRSPTPPNGAWHQTSSGSRRSRRRSRLFRPASRSSSRRADHHAAHAGELAESAEQRERGPPIPSDGARLQVRLVTARAPSARGSTSRGTSRRCAARGAAAPLPGAIDEEPHAGTRKAVRSNWSGQLVLMFSNQSGMITLALHLGPTMIGVEIWPKTARPDPEHEVLHYTEHPGLGPGRCRERRMGARRVAAGALLLANRSRDVSARRKRTLRRGASQSRPAGRPPSSAGSHLDKEGIPRCRLTGSAPPRRGRSSSLSGALREAAGQGLEP